MGGGDGVGSLESLTKHIVSKLNKIHNNTQVVVICGNNEVLKNKINSLYNPPPPYTLTTRNRGTTTNTKYTATTTTNKGSSTNIKSNKSKVHVVAKGFVNNVDEYMSTADLLVTKAGPGTIAEAMIRGV